ncbi:MAG: hypothetical protein IPM50_03285 [Acidobacteriota bacterium]|nr:MAG: hypothetical protein IPM50_03285 [Acidobacteriota bacterium]
MRFNTEEEIRELAEKFEAAAIARNAWKHAEHLAVALVYVEDLGETAAVGRMRSGILNLLENGFGLDLTKEMPYHETLTVFWIKTVAEFNAANEGLSLLEKANELIKTHDKDLPLRFYTRELLFSDAARAKFLPPDIKN